MTTRVLIINPHGNSWGVKVRSFIESTGQVGETAPILLGDGQRQDSWISRGQGLVITEIEKSELPPMDRPLSVAERMAGVGFNPGQRADVANCKDGYAERIAEMISLREHSPDPEVKRLASIAITSLQTAQMFAVKAITWGA